MKARQPKGAAALKPSEILRGGSEYIKKYGWRQGKYGYMGECACAIGSMVAAVNPALADGTPLNEGITHPRQRHAIDEAITALSQAAGGATRYFIVGYNDTQGRTRAEVLRKMGQAARQLEKEGK